MGHVSGGKASQRVRRMGQGGIRGGVVQKPERLEEEEVDISAQNPSRQEGDRQQMCSLACSPEQNAKETFQAAPLLFIAALFSYPCVQETDVWYFFNPNNISFK